MRSLRSMGTALRTCSTVMPSLSSKVEATPLNWSLDEQSKMDIKVRVCVRAHVCVCVCVCACMSENGMDL